MVNLTVLLCVVSILLVPFAAAGLSLINTGLGRSRSAAHAMLAALCLFGVAVLIYFFCGYALQGFPGRPDHAFTIGQKSWSWVAAEPFFLRGIPLDLSPVSLAVWLQLYSVALAAIIPLSSGADRWRLGAMCISTIFLAGLTYPLFAHWAWGGGWLAQLGTNYGLGRGFLDAGGSGSIQSVGGLTALAVAWILGPRRGKYPKEGMPAAIPGHNTVLVMFGCLLTLAGWTGLNSAGSMLFAAADPTKLVLVAINTTLSAAASALAAAAITRVRFGKPDASLCANGWVGGLTASSAACGFVPPAAAVLIGAVAGCLVTLSVEFLELRLTVDDPGGAVSVHAIGGIWGLLALGLFVGNDTAQWLAQLIGVGTLIGFILPLTYGVNIAINRFYPQRVAIEGERQGMDLHELGAGAYPDFFTHSDDLTH